MRGEHKDKEDPTRWIRLRCDWRADVETHFRTLQAEETKIQKMMEFLRHWRSPLPSKYTGNRSLPGITKKPSKQI